MKVTFVSNYINHHQIPLSNAIYNILGEGYHFIETIPMEKERINMGWNSDTASIPYVLRYYEDSEKCQAIIDDSDVVMFGGVEDESYIADRIAAGKIILRYSERLYREGQWKAVSPRGLIKKYKDHTSNRKKPMYLLCTGGYVADDYNIVKSYPGKKFRWGYFTEFIPNDGSTKQNDGKVHILWAGRFLKLKNPTTALTVASALKDENIDFELTMIGSGEQDEILRKTVEEKGLADFVTFKGSMTPPEVREYMLKADIFLFTSNYREGWGAVLNEAMNSRCACIASYAAGSTPFLIKNGYNGIVYKESKTNKEICDAAVKLAKDGELRKKMGDNAYNTIESKWNPEYAAEHLVKLMENLLEGRVVFEEEGPLSSDPAVKQRKMYKYLMENSEKCQN